MRSLVCLGLLALLISAVLSYQASADGKIELLGKVIARPGNLVEVLAPMPCRVLFDEGFRPSLGKQVRAGQTLVKLEHHYKMHDWVHLINERWPIQVEALAAKRRAIETEVELERARYLYQNKVATLKELQAAEAAAALAAREYQRWRERLENHDQQIRQKELVRRPLQSPISGTLVEVNFTQGQLVYEGEKLFTILDLSAVWIEAQVAEHQAARLSRLPESIPFAAPAFPGKQFIGSLIKIGQKVDEQTRAVPVFFEVANREKLLRPGMFVTAQVASP